MTENPIKKEIIQTFGDAYKAFGLNKLMGHVVALLIYSPKPISLGEIAKELKRTKGPVSQILRRLNDHKLIRKTWSSENNRKDYYEIEPDIFENAYRNNLELIKNNTRIAKRLRSLLKKNKDKNNPTLELRLKEMEAFYMLMEKKHKEFLAEWEIERSKLLK